MPFKDDGKVGDPLTLLPCRRRAKDEDVRWNARNSAESSIFHTILVVVVHEWSDGGGVWGCCRNISMIAPIPNRPQLFNSDDDVFILFVPRVE